MVSLIPLAPAAMANEQPGAPLHEQREAEKPSMSLALNLKDQNILEITLRNDGSTPVTVFKKALPNVLASLFLLSIKDEQGNLLFEHQSRTLYELQAGTFELIPLQPGETVRYVINLAAVIPPATLKQLPAGRNILDVSYLGLSGEFERNSLPTQSIILE